MTELREELDILRKEMAEARQIAEAKYAQVCERLACLEQEKKELRRRLLLAEWHTGNYVKFAQYEWLILDRQGSRALLLSRHAVEKRRFDERSSNWEGSEIRSYLNGEFYASAFTAEERKRIIQTNEKDYVFLLSLNEALAYFKSDRARVCLLGGQAYWYWLRSTGDSSNRAAHILDVGSIKTYGLVYDSAGIRPAIWVNLDC